jgi:hypothetical protein
MGELLRSGMEVARKSHAGFESEAISRLPLLKKRKFTALPEYIFQQYDCM